MANCKMSMKLKYFLPVFVLLLMLDIQSAFFLNNRVYTFVIFVSLADYEG